MRGTCFTNCRRDEVLPCAHIFAYVAALTFTGAVAIQAADAVYPVEEASIAGVEAAYPSGHTTAHAMTQAYPDRIAAYDKRA